MPFWATKDVKEVTMLKFYKNTKYENTIIEDFIDGTKMPPCVKPCLTTKVCCILFVLFLLQSQRAHCHCKVTGSLLSDESHHPGGGNTSLALLSVLDITLDQTVTVMKTY